MKLTPIISSILTRGLQLGLRPAVLDDLSEVEFATRFNPHDNIIVRNGDKSLY
jgi:hypothetical protein